MNQILDHPIDQDNEALIISNALKSEKNRELLIKLVPYDKFRVKEFQTIAWGIIESSRSDLEINLDAILLKSKTCPTRQIIDFNFIQQLISNFNEVPEENFKDHIIKLNTDHVKAKMSDWVFSSFYKRCLDPTTKLSDLDESLSYAKGVVDKGFSLNKLDFAGMETVAARFEEEKSKGIDIRTTGFTQLDRYVSEGLKAGQITTVAALSSMGKSSFVLSMMKNLSNKGIPTAQFALEMNSMSLFAKLLAFNTRLPISSLIKDINKLSEEDRHIYNSEIARLRKNKHIFLNDKPSQSVSDLREQIMLLQDFIYPNGGDGYIVVPIDLFGKLKDFQGSDNFARDYEKKCNEIQIMARELAIHFVLVAQINREVSKRKNKRPTMNDLKNAHALTEVSDLILGIHRPFYEPETALKYNAIYGINTQDEDEEDDDSSLFENTIDDNPDRNLYDANQLLSL